MEPLQRELKHGVVVVRFDPRVRSLDEAHIDLIRAPILSAADADPPLVVVDLSNIDFFGSSFIELLFRLWSRLKGRQGQFAMCGVSEYCREVLSVTNLDQLWQIYDSAEQAAAALKQRVTDRA
jgi:anti-anti-sigma factor